MSSKLRALVCTLTLLAIAAPAFAAGPLLIFDPTTQTAYSYPGPVDVYTDLGGFGPLTNAQADVLTGNGFAEWTGVATATFAAAVAGDFSAVGLPDITGANAGLVVGADNGGGIHVMYDDDGTITANFFGAPPGVLGIASPDFAIGADLTESWAMVNGQAVDPLDVGGASFGGVFTHEFGHSINLAHTQVNGDVGFFGNNSAPGACAGFGGLTIGDLETMYPFLDPSNGGTGPFQAVVDNLDDISSLSNIYPAAGWPPAAGQITGTVIAGDGFTEVTGVNVVARNLADPFGDCVSALSGDYTQGALGPDGRYTLNGLTPGADYVVYIDAIVAGGFSTTPVSPLPVDEEYYNGGSESTDPNTDSPCDFVAVQGGSSGIDILFNDDGSLDLGDDDFVEVPLPFAFEFCGTSWNSVFVGSNGFVTFGAGNTDFSESVAELQSGPARIAPLWVDLSPNQAGSIFAEDIGGGEFEVRWENVTEFLAGNSNTFSLILRDDNTFRMSYDQLDAVDGITGVSEGNGVPSDPGPIDVSTAPQPITGGAPGEMVYEQFIGTLDLAFSAQEWDECPDFEIVIANAVEQTCYGSGGNGDGQLYTVDINTGAATAIGGGIAAGMPGLAINSLGEIYGTERVSGDLYRVDGVTGQAFFVASTGLSFLDGIAFDDNDVLYGIGFDPPNFTLHIIDPGNGSTTPVGPTFDVYTGLTFDPSDGELYASVGGFLPNLSDHSARIDRNTGSPTILGQTGFGGAIPDLHAVGGVLYASKKISGSSNLITIDKTDGSGSLIGATGVNSLSGLAYYAGCADGPEIDVVLSQDSLWPPNHKMVEICATVTVTDDCDASVDWTIVSITSNEPVSGQGDGNTDPDWVFSPNDNCFQLRSERAGGGNGRKYTITFEATDSDGNTTQATACVDVPHDQSGNALAAGGVAGGTVEEGAILVTLVIPGTPGQRAEDIDVNRVFLGHQGGATRPLGTNLMETTGDGRRDLVANFSANVVRQLEAAAPNGSGGKLALHYTSEDGVNHYLVKNIMGAEGIELIAGRTGTPGAENDDVGDGGTPDPGSATTQDDGTFGQEMTVEVFTVTGRRIRQYTRVGLPMDSELGWDGRDFSGRPAPSGVYFYRISTADSKYVRKVSRIN